MILVIVYHTVVHHPPTRTKPITYDLWQDYKKHSHQNPASQWYSDLRVACGDMNNTQGPPKPSNHNLHKSQHDRRHIVELLLCIMKHLYLWDPQCHCRWCPWRSVGTPGKECHDATKVFSCVWSSLSPCVPSLPPGAAAVCNSLPCLSILSPRLISGTHTLATSLLFRLFTQIYSRVAQMPY